MVVFPVFGLYILNVSDHVGVVGVVVGEITPQDCFSDATLAFAASAAALLEKDCQSFDLYTVVVAPEDDELEDGVEDHPDEGAGDLFAYQGASHLLAAFETIDPFAIIIS